MTCILRNNLADGILSLEKRFFGDSALIASQQLNDIVEELRSRNIEQQALPRQIRLINQVLFHEHKFRFRGSDPARNFTLTGTFLDRCGNCLGLTTAYAAIADRVGVEVQPVLYEGHIAVCFERNGMPYPIEVSRGGAILQGRLADLMYSGKGSKQVISNAQLLAVHMSNQAAFVYVPQGKYNSALSLLERAVDVFPEYIAAWINMTVLFVRLKMPERAATSLERVLDLSPSGPYLKHTLSMMEHVVQGKLPEDLHIA